MDVQDIVDRCIEVHGGTAYQQCAFKYSFRDKDYTYQYDEGSYRYARSFTDESGDRIEDVLTNGGFKRSVNGKPVKLTQKKKTSYSNSVNSVHYFAFLPFFLNDPAVNTQLLGETKIDGQVYYKIKVTFDREGGGDDYEDIHMYWIHKERLTMDYMGYSFIVDGGGVRFRKAYNSREIGGIRFQDYINYKHDVETPVDEMDGLYEAGKLVELSRIELENIIPF